MSPDDVAGFARGAAQRYADHASRGGLWSGARALANAERMIKVLLPEGEPAALRYLFWIVERATGERIGHIWAAITQPAEPVEATILELYVAEGSRRSGYGAGAVWLLEEQMSRDGVQRVLGTVFSHNAGMHRLVRELGYEPVHMGYLKTLDR